MFRRSTSFDQDLSSWNTSSVEDMGWMFEDASSFNNDLADWDISKVFKMFSMFRDATSFDQDLSSWNTSGVEDMGWMFRDATSFDQSLCSWGDKLPTDASVSLMFYGTSCPNQEDPDLSTNPPGPFCYSC
jgi:surface protein